METMVMPECLYQASQPMLIYRTEANRKSGDCYRKFHRLQGQNQSHFLGEIGDGEGFGQKVDVAIQNTMMDDNVFGVARHIQRFNLGLEGDQFLMEFTAIHVGHNDVG